VQYKVLIESLVKFGMSVCLEDPILLLRIKLAFLVHTAMKVMGRSESVYEQSVLREAQRILTGLSHVVFSLLVDNIEFSTVNFVVFKPLLSLLLSNF